MFAGIAFSATGPNLMVNGAFEDPENPTKYWTYDYKALQNDNYIGNDKWVTLLPAFGGKKNVLKMEITDATSGGGGVWVDSPLIPFEQGCRYRFSLTIQASAPYHIYVQGYQWKPGIKPYDNPSWFDMRARFKGSFNPIDDKNVNLKGWTTIRRDFPEKQLSSLAMPNIKAVKFVSLHICGITGNGLIYIKELVVEKLPEGYTGGKTTDDDRRKVKPGTTPSKPIK